MDSELEPEPGRSRLGAFLGGALLGLVLCAIVAVVASLMMPLPDRTAPAEAVESAPAAGQVVTEQSQVEEATEDAVDTSGGGAVEVNEPTNVATDEPADDVTDQDAETGDASESVILLRDTSDPESSETGLSDAVDVEPTDAAEDPPEQSPDSPVTNESSAAPSTANEELTDGQPGDEPRDMAE